MGSDQVINTTIERTAQIDNSVMSLINESGGTLDQGAVCVIDTGNAESFTTTITQGLTTVKILKSRTIDGDPGLLFVVGKGRVLTTGVVAIGDRLVTSTTAGKAESNGASGKGFATALTADDGSNGYVEASLEQSVVVDGQPYTPDVLGDWDGVDPGEVPDALDYLAANRIGKQTIFVPAGAMRPTKSNGCSPHVDVETTAGRPDITALDFDDGADEHAQFQIGFPKSWDEGTITFQAFWTSLAVDTDGVAWALQGVSVQNDSPIDVVYGTAIVVSDDNISAAEDMLVTSESGDVTVAGAAADTLTFFRVFRDVSNANDDMTEDARLLGIKLFFTTDASTDD